MMFASIRETVMQNVSEASRVVIEQIREATKRAFQNKKVTKITKVEIVAGTVGAKIRTARLKKKWTQADLSDKIGRPTAYVGKWETGKRKLSDLEAARLSTVLNIPTKELMYN